jgi:Uma2 family endonuclease
MLRKGTAVVSARGLSFVVEVDQMSIASVAGSVESPSKVPGNGSSASLDAFPFAVPDDMLYEVVDGKIVEKIVGAYEGDIAGILYQFLGMFASTNRLGRAFIEVIFRIDQAKNLQRRPDVAFVNHARWPAGRRPPKKVGVWDMVPDLAVEVVSPSNSASQVQEKMHEYFRAGVTAVWIIYPEQEEVYVYASPAQIQVLQVGQELDGRDLIPGFRLPVATLFEDEAD